jgi:hypothetical protein
MYKFFCKLTTLSDKVLVPATVTIPCATSLTATNNAIVQVVVNEARAHEFITKVMGDETTIVEQPARREPDTVT